MVAEVPSVWNTRPDVWAVKWAIPTPTLAKGETIASGRNFARNEGVMKTEEKSRRAEAAPNPGIMDALDPNVREGIPSTGSST